MAKKNYFSKLCKNLYFLYFVYALVIINILTYLYLKQWNNILLFLILIVVFQYLTKNICVLLLASLLITNIFLSNTMLFEGFKDKKEINKAKKQHATLDKHMKQGKAKHKKIVKKFEKLPTNKKNKIINHEDVQDKHKTLKSLKKKKVDDTQIDYSKTYKDSMNHLSSILSNKGLEGLTNETRELIDSQKALTSNIQNLEPWLQNAGGMLKKLDLGNITSTLSSFDGLFGGGGGDGKKGKIDLKGKKIA